jgi:alpha-beta hydrolase superfamily lysophospholipase
LAETDSNWKLNTFTASDGYLWRYRHYPCRLPEGAKPIATLICLHGIQSHAGWYDHSSTVLSRAGYEVYFLDRRGSGVNEAARGDTPGYRRLLDDIAEFLGELRSRTADLATPVFLVAISWGGKLAAALQLKHPGLVAGLALLCPGFCPRVRSPLGDRIRIALARLVSPTRSFEIPLNDPKLFTDTPKWQDFIRNDSLALRRATARLLVESVRLDRLLRRADRQIDIPILLMLAGRDRIIDSVRTRRLVEQFKSPDLEVLEYPQAGHTLEFETNTEVFIGDLLDWLGRHCRRSASGVA